MNKGEKATLVEAWALQRRILRQLTELAHINEALAYGCIRTAETLIDMKLVDRIRAGHEVLKGRNPEK